jgi:hypothetical protein
VSALESFWLGAVLGALVWVPFGRWSLLLLMRRSWRAQQLRQLAQSVRRPAPAGWYVDRRRVRAGVCGLEPQPGFRRP